MNTSTLPALIANSEPPYYRVKTAAWDRQWNRDNQFFSWFEQVLAEYKRVLKPLASFYCFCSPYLSAKTELLIGEYFKVINEIVWLKKEGRHKGVERKALNKYFPQTERIIFCESKKSLPFHFEPIRAYLSSVFNKAGLNRADINRITGSYMAGHWVGSSQFSLPTAEHYQVLKQNLPELKPYEELWQEYETLKKTCPRRKFTLSKDEPHTDVWHFDVVLAYPGKHPCEKPVDLIEHMVKVSSEPGDTVMDTFLGSGTTAVACHNLKRQFVGCENDTREFINARQRLESVNQINLFNC